MPDKENLFESEIAQAFATTEQLLKESETRAAADALITNNVNTISNDLNNYKEIIQKLLHDKQDKTDLELETNSKTIIKAINEIKATTVDKEIIIKKQDKTDSSLETDSKLIAGAINEIKTSVIDNETINNKQDKSDNNLTTTDKSVIGAINEVNLKIETKTEENNSYKLFASSYSAAESYTFSDYDENYWHLFVFEFENMVNRTVCGTLEHPPKLSYASSQNVLLDYSSQTAINLVFRPSTRLLEAHNHTQKRVLIKKISIYRKRG